MAAKVKVKRVGQTRTRGQTKISSKNQVTLPSEVLNATGLKKGDRLRVLAAGPGQVRLIRLEDLIAEYAKKLAGVFDRERFEELHKEWD